MKQKELKNLAKKIALLEEALQDCAPDERHGLEEEIAELCGKVDNIKDMLLIDDLVQDYISKN